MSVNIPKHIAKHYQGLRQPDATRDEKYSPLHDAIMGNIAECMKEFGTPEIFSELWTSSLFPERLTKCILTLIEEQKERERQTGK